MSHVTSLICGTKCLLSIILAGFEVKMESKGLYLPNAMFWLLGLHLKNWTKTITSFCLHSLKCSRQDGKGAIGTKHIERVREYFHLSQNSLNLTTAINRLNLVQPSVPRRTMNQADARPWYNTEGLSFQGHDIPATLLDLARFTQRCLPHLQK